MIGAYQSGVNCTSSESNNIYIQNPGAASENNTIRIGTQGSGNAQQNACYIAGIYGTAVSGSPVYINSSGQLGASLVAFSAYNSTNPTNITGDGTLYTVAYDAVPYNAGTAYNNTTYTFTAPYTGIYQFNVTVGVGLLNAAHDIGYMQLVTTARTYTSNYSNLGASRAANNIFMASFCN
jgi:hypothetical protein